MSSSSFGQRYSPGTKIVDFRVTIPTLTECLPYWFKALRDIVSADTISPSPSAQFSKPGNPRWCVVGLIATE